MLVQEEVVMINFKGKRSKRPRPSSPLALTMVTSSSNTAEISGGVDFGGVMSDVTGSSDIRVTSSASDSGGFTQSTDEEEEDMANCLILLANGQSHKSSQSPVIASASKAAAAGTVVEIYQCKTCNKSFSSFQALGGHRASHKKPNKPITPEERKASIRDQIHKPDNILSNHTNLSLQLSNRVLDSNSHPQNKSRVHECSMCGAEFASGQALGGHMRRHRPIPTASTNIHGAESQEAAKRQKNLLSLDLNLPAPEDDHHRESKFPFTPKEQVIVFSSSPLIDCQY